MTSRWDDPHDFAALAERFLAFLGARAEISNADLAELLWLLGKLIVGAATLPDVEPGEVADQPHSRVRAPVVAAAGLYWNVQIPLAGVDRAEPPTPSLGDLGDDLGDIASDLAEGLAYWRLDEDAGRREAVWRWRFGFRTHWGVHAADALRLLLEVWQVGPAGTARHRP